MARPLIWPLVAEDRASAPFNRAAAGADRLAGASGRATAGLAAMQKKAALTGAALTRHVTLPILGIVAASAKVATDFNTEMTKIQTQAGGTAKGVKVLSREVLGLSKTAQQGPVQLAEALYHLKSVGMDNVKAMHALKTSSDLAAVGGNNLEDTANALAGAWKSGVKGAQNFGHAAALVNAIIGSGNMHMQDFTSALGTGLLASAKTFGVTLKSVGSALALLTDEGVPANVALTRMRMTFSLMAAPSAKAEAAMKTFGVTGTQLANDLRKPNGLLAAAVDIKKGLDAAGMSAVQQEQALSHAFGGGRSSSFVLSLVNQVGKLGQKWDQVSASVSKYGSDVAAQANTPAAKFHVLLSNLEAAGVKLGTRVLPILTTMAHDLTGVVKWFEHLSPATQSNIIKFGLLAAAAGPVLRIFSSLIGVTTSLVRGGIAIAGWAASGVMAMTRFAQGARMAETSIEGMSTRSYGAGLRMRQSFNGMSASVRSFASGAAKALGGAAIGVTIGELTKDSSNATKAIGFFGATLAGGAVAGPIGAATAALGDLATNLSTAGYDSKQVTADTNNLAQAMIADGNAIGANTRALVANRLEKSGVLQMAQQLGLNLHQVTDAALGNSRAMYSVRSQLAGLQSSGKASSDQVAKLGFMLHGTSDEMSSATSEAQRLHAAIDGLKSKTVNVVTHFTQVGTGPARASMGLAGGGIVRGPGTGTSDTAGVYALSDGEAVIPAKAVSRHLGLIRSLIAAGRGLAQGGLMGYVTGAGFRGRSATIAEAIAMAESGGNAHAHNAVPPDNSYGLFQINMIGGLGPARRAAFHLGSNAALYNPAVNARVAYALSNGGRDFSPWTTYTSGAYQQYLGGHGTLSNSTTALSGGSSHSGAAAKIAAARQKARQQATATHQAIRAGNTLGHGLGKDYSLTKSGRLAGSTLSIGDIRSQLQALGGDLRDAGASKQFMDRLKKEDAAILGAARARNKAAAVLQRAHAAWMKARAKERADYGTFRSARMGSFDITSAGTDPVTGKVTAGSILAQQGQAISRLKEWNRDLRHLAPLLPVAYFRELEGMSPDQALPQLRALMSMNPGQLRRLRRQSAEFTSLSNSGAGYGSHRLDAGAVRADREAERKAAARERRAQKHLHDEFASFKEFLAHSTFQIDLKKGTLTFAGQQDAKHVAKMSRGRHQGGG